MFWDIIAWQELKTNDASSVDALVYGCSLCEDGSCMSSIGMGGRPDENGETTLDAMVMDGWVKIREDFTEDSANLSQWRCSH